MIGSVDHPPFTREERRSLFLHRAIARRLAEDPERVLARAWATVARMRARHSGDDALLRAWEVLLASPVTAVIARLTDPDPQARELRHVTPFAGLLTAAERAATYRAFAAEERSG